MEDELLSEFAIESLEHLQDVEPLLLRMEELRTAEVEDLNRIFRAMHSIKGAAGFIGLDEIQSLSHAAEGLLMKLRDGELDIDEAMPDALLRVVDVLRGQLSDLPSVGRPTPPDLVEQLVSLSAGRGSGAAPARGIQLRFGDVARSLGLMDADQVQEVLEIQAGEGQGHRTFGTIAVQRGLLSPGQVDLVRSEQRIRLAEAERAREAEQRSAAQTVQPEREPRESGRTGKQDSVRVSVTLLDELMNLAGELVLGRNQLIQVLSGLEDHQLRRILQGVDSITTQLQENIMHTRMQPMRVLFDRVPRQVRDVSSKLGKEVELEISGKDVELDRSILDALRDPLTHLVRNSLDHGVEKPDERVAAGKEARGRVDLRAYHQAGQIVVEIEDDGRGIDPERLRRVAVERGAISADQARALSDAEARALIFHPGFSTAKEVSDVSGRGVGMDVVRSNIEAHGGRIEIDSQVGRGTLIRIQLPLTLAIIPALTVSAGGQRFAIPQLNLAEVVRLRGEEVHRQRDRVRGVEVLRLRDRLLPLVHLDQALGLARQAPRAERMSIVVLKAGARRYGLVVDELHDNEEIVVKPLSSLTKSCTWFAGATILGDGRVVMILDALGILSRVGLSLAEATEELDRCDGGACDGDVRRTPMLLFENSGPEQYVVGLEELARIERVQPEGLDRVGSAEFMRHNGRSIPIVRLEHHLPVAPCHPEPGQGLFVLIPRGLDEEVGILVSRIVDTRELAFEPGGGVAPAPGLRGSSLIGDRMTLFLDTRELLAAAGHGGIR